MSWGHGYSQYLQHVTPYDLMRVEGFSRLVPSSVDTISVWLMEGQLQWRDATEEWDPDDYHSWGAGWRPVRGKRSTEHDAILQEIIDIWGINKVIDRHNARTEPQRQYDAQRRELNYRGRFDKDAPMKALKPLDIGPISAWSSL